MSNNNSSLPVANQVTDVTLADNSLEQFDSLTEDQQKILYLAAIHTSPMQELWLCEMFARLSLFPDKSAFAPTSSSISNCTAFTSRLKSLFISNKDTVYFRSGEILTLNEKIKKIKSSKTDSLTSDIQKLVQDKWLEPAAGKRIHYRHPNREQIIKRLVESNKYIQYSIAVFQTIKGMYFLDQERLPEKHRIILAQTAPKTTEDFYRELRHNLILGMDNGINFMFTEHEYRQSRPSLQNNPFDYFGNILKFCTSKNTQYWFVSSDHNCRLLICQYLLNESTYLLSSGLDDIWDILLDTARVDENEKLIKILLIDYAFCSGKLFDARLDRLPGDLSYFLLKAHRLFIAGNSKEAVLEYDSAFRAMYDLVLTKNCTIPFLSGIFQSLAEIHAGRIFHTLNTLKPILKNSVKLTESVDLHLNTAWYMLNRIALNWASQYSPRVLLKDSCERDEKLHWVTKLLLAYESVWYQLSPDTNLLATYPFSNVDSYRGDFFWVAAEVCEVVDRLYNSPHNSSQKIPDIVSPTIDCAKKNLDWVKTFREKTKSAPLCDMFKPRPRWEQLINTLEQLVDTFPKTANKSNSSKTSKKTRLVWQVTKFSNGHLCLDFTPCEQTWDNKSQCWSKDKLLTLLELFKKQNTLKDISEQDREICASLIFSRYGRSANCRFPDDIALKFVGHPLLFSGDGKSMRVELLKGQCEMAIQERDDHLQVIFSPPLTEFKSPVYISSAVFTNDATLDFFVIEESKYRFKVVKLTKTENQIRQLIGADGQSFPKEAKSNLMRMIGKLSAVVTINTDEKIEFAGIPEVVSDDKLYLYLTSSDEGLQAEFFVKPLGATTATHRPGVGSSRMISDADGQKVLSVRNLDAESKKRDQFIAQLQAFKSATSLSNDCYLFETLPDTLTFLSELKEYEESESAESNESNESTPTSELLESIPAKKTKTKKTKSKPASVKRSDVEVYWFKGEKYSVSSLATYSNLNLKFLSMDEWLSAEGSLVVDGESIEISRLLDLVDEGGDNRFIKLEGRKFIALTNELRKRLCELKRLSNTKDKKLQIHPLAAAGLEDFFDAVPSLQTSPIWKKVKSRIVEARDYSAPFPSGFVGDLRDYQLEGYSWLARCAKWGVGCCLADDMGLGKTVQALALLLLRADKGPALVVAPTSVCFNWEREAQKFTPSLNIKRVQSITSKFGSSKEDRDNLITSAQKRDVVITSYTLLQQEIETFAKKEYATIILDESQAIKNPESQRAKSVLMLRADFRVAMTGTPIENNLTELWSLFRFLNAGLLGSQKSFESRFAVPVQRDRSVSAKNSLRRLIHPFILRRTKSQVLEELPARTEIIREIELSKKETALYEAARLKAIKELQSIREKNTGKGQLQILAVLTRLRQLCCNAKLVLPDSDIESSKLEAFCEIMQELKENRHKVLVFSQFVKHLELLRAELDSMGISYQYLDGSVPERERQKRVDAFQSGDSDAFLISIKAGGSGLNLTAADYVIHTDPWWNPAVEDQATDRAHRIGQTRPVTVYRLITQGTIEEKIVRLHNEKRNLADKLLEGTDQATRLSADELIDILQS
ncbi:MAG: DEAD/DEAH box helicase [Planctomycetaceae bacterium]|jgi:SNF2 family DNA or RNA helicase|nr:DEAD/DEAH box helicase [Planctomycetaceae bacterium]